MGCELSQTLLHAYLDGELDAAGALDFERHLESCPECAAALELEQALHQSLQKARLFEPAPAELRRKVRASLPAPSSAPAARPSTWLWPALAAASLLIAFFGWQFFALQARRTQQEAFALAALDAHLRSLQPGHLTDVASTDQHTVKPWFDGKVDFVPPVQDFAANEFPLLGGRLDIVDGHSVAALVYGRRKHFVNVFVWRSSDSAPLVGSGARQGYHWLAWRQDGLLFCAVSDAAAADLDQLRLLFLRN